MVALAAGIAVALGATEAAWRALIRATARTSLVLFSAAFVASSLPVVWRGWFSRWLLANRRYVGVSFALSHGVHLLAIIALEQVTTEEVFSTAALVGGGGAYVFIALMTATSFDRTAAWLGPRAWRRLHRAGMYYVWTIFAVSYIPRAFATPRYAVPVAVLAIDVGVRAAAWRLQRARRIA